MKTILIIITILFTFNISYASDIFKKHYNSKYEVIGYSKIESGKEIHYNTSFNRTGHTVYEKNRAVKYNNQYQKVEIIDNDGTIYDANYKKIGRQIEDNSRIIIYNNEWKKQEYREK